MNHPNTLLIIGNGFDLQCRLQSKYEQFFAWLRQDNSRAGSNLWAVHFLNAADPRGNKWSDVEYGLLQVMDIRPASREPSIYNWINNYKSSISFSQVPTYHESRYLQTHQFNTK